MAASWVVGAPGGKAVGGAASCRVTVGPAKDCAGGLRSILADGAEAEALAGLCDFGRLICGGAGAALALSGMREGGSGAVSGISGFCDCATGFGAAGGGGFSCGIGIGSSAGGSGAKAGAAGIEECGATVGSEAAATGGTGLAESSDGFSSAASEDDELCSVASAGSVAMVPGIAGVGRSNDGSCSAAAADDGFCSIASEGSVAMVPGIAGVVWSDCGVWSDEGLCSIKINGIVCGADWSGRDGGLLPSHASNASAAEWATNDRAKGRRAIVTSPIQGVAMRRPVAFQSLAPIIRARAGETAQASIYIASRYRSGPQEVSRRETSDMKRGLGISLCSRVRVLACRGDAPNGRHRTRPFDRCGFYARPACRGRRSGARLHDPERLSRRSRSGAERPQSAGRPGGVPAPARSATRRAAAVPQARSPLSRAPRR